MKADIKRLISAYEYGHALERSFYTSREVYDVEMEHIFCHHWIFAGHSTDIPDAGDFFLVEFDAESVIVARTQDGGIKAHLNVCRHRGSRICLEPEGSTKALVCPYHAWTYNLDGALVGARQMANDFDKSAHGLHPVHVALVGGLIFINLADEPPALDRLHDELADVFDLYGFHTMKTAHKERYTMEANWKLAVENYQECYHCAPSHEEFAQLHPMADTPAKFQAQRTKYLENLDQGDPATHVKIKEANCYFDLAPTGQEGFQYSLNPLRPGTLSGSKDGQPVGPLLGNLKAFDGGAAEFMVGPLSFFLLYDDHMVGYRFLPAGPNKSVCDVFWFVRSDAVEGADYDKAKLTWLWDITTHADKEIITNNQRGVNSRFYVPGRLSEMEHFEQHFLNWYIQTLRKAFD